MRRLLKTLRGKAREKLASAGVRLVVRRSETIERNEAYEGFSAACVSSLGGRQTR
jgi:hypothetical protein